MEKIFKLIGLGISKNHLNGKIIEEIEDSDLIIFENYTSYFEDKNYLINILKKLKENKVFIEGDREFVESELEKFIKEEKYKKITLLVLGDPLSATTHIHLINFAKKYSYNTKIINNVSIFSLISRIGLSMYNYGKTISIPFLIRDKRITIETPIKVINENKKIGANTLLLMDLDPKNGDYLKAEEAINYLIKNKEKITNFEEDKLIIASRLAWKDEKIIFIHNKEINEKVINKIKEKKLEAPLVLVYIHKINDLEEEYLNNFKLI